MILLGAVAWALPLLVSPAGAPAYAIPVAGLDWGTGPVSSRLAGSQPCADLVFVGARASGEEAPYGPTVARVRDQLVAGTAAPPGEPTGRVRQLYLDYPATPPQTLFAVGVDRLLLEPAIPANDYTASVDAGVRELRSVLQDSVARCRDERWVLAGFSQGAQVINQVLADHPDPARVADAILVGNPGHHQGQRVVEHGTAAPGANGLIPSMLYLRDEAARTRGDHLPGAIGAIGVVQAAYDLRENTPPEGVMVRLAAENRLAVPEDIPRAHSVCAAGDLICDTGPAMWRILTQRSNFDAEIVRTRPIHGGYDDAQLSAATAPVTEHLRATLPERAEPPSVVPAPEPDRTPLWWVLAAFAAVMAIAAVVALRRTRRPRRSRPARD